MIIVLLSVLIICVVIFIVAIIRISRRRWCCRRIHPNEMTTEELKVERVKQVKNEVNKVKFIETVNPNKSEECSICFEKFANEDKVRETKCNHVFHSKCLVTWVKAKPRDPDCPHCRAKLI